MPRRQFVADLAAAVQGASVAGISDVQPGGDDGEFTFLCVADNHKLKISALIPGKFWPDRTLGALTQASALATAAHTLHAV